MSLIEVQNVTKIFGPRPKQALARYREGLSKEELLAETGHTLGLSDVSLSIAKGEIFVVMGLSGSGKSTLIRHFNRLIEPTDGQILVHGNDVLKLSAGQLQEFRRTTMSMVFQRFGLMPHRTVLQNVAYGLAVRGVPKRDREEQAMGWVQTVGLSGYEHQYPTQLSGGMQQRVGLARALATDAEILLMDEAFSALDPLIRSQMQDQLIELQAELGKTIVFITHDLDEALRIGDQIAILKDGRLSQVGKPAEILLHPADDYVASFVRDVNRARVLTVDTVMKPPIARLTSGNLERALAEMRRVNSPFGYVEDSDGYRGIARQDRVEEAISAKGEGDLYSLAEAGPTLTADDALESALPTALDTDYPLPVVDDSGALMGVVSSREMSSVLSPPKAVEHPANEDEPATPTVPAAAADDGEPPKAAAG
ncbi:glycine betaine/L-proline ABC transporter ATP-binding protein [Acuticoccus sp. MNP-M23]|uniref:quaternary amine ABC transporter ATP-binding protein n=1 Tax=Acuticoccus sp. MNP-M23 TaxID=3072793 RepID=UPI002814D5A8|nr:glycine betaine/L-proline ABC transporter ATP-binding protein [Acuticoccus sp. MNP-M23]WMS41123.1 glycine betaine/L-proline ABC transporter ATP-binding protein [Acuticoccus sp. MNP-M23]